MTSEVLHADRERTDSMMTSMAIFAGGAALGAIAVLLLAPQAGRESRKQLTEYSRRTGQTMNEWATTAFDLLATRKKVTEAAQEESGKQRKRDEVVKPRPHALAH